MSFFISDKRKLITTLAVLLVTGFAATSLVNYFVSKSVIRESIVARELPLTADNLYSEIQKDLVRPVLIASMMASNTFLRDWVVNGEQDGAKITQYLREVKQQYGAFTTFFISERTRVYYQTEGILKKVSEDAPRDAWYFRVRNMDAPYEISFDPDFANKDVLTTFINFRVFDNAGNYLGVAGVGIAVDTIRGLLDKYQQRYRSNVYFFDQQDGALLFGTDAHVAGTKISSIDGLGTLAERIRRDGAGDYEYEAGGRTHLLNVRLVPELKWYLLVERVGHLTGDGVIRQVARLIKAALRHSDIVCRWGGEEFLVVIKGSAGTEALPLAEKIRSTVEAGAFRCRDTVVPVTISLGIASYIDGETPDELIARADQALYAAKGEGRNLVRSADAAVQPRSA